MFADPLLAVLDDLNLGDEFRHGFGQVVHGFGKVGELLFHLSLLRRQRAGQDASPDSEQADDGRGQHEPRGRVGGIFSAGYDVGEDPQGQHLLDLPRGLHLVALADRVFDGGCQGRERSVNIGGVGLRVSCQ